MPSNTHTTLRPRNAGSRVPSARRRRNFSLLLPFLGEVEPELEDERALVGEHALEAVDLADRAHQFLGRGILAAAADVRPRSPRAELPADASLGRQRAPEAPHGRALALLVRG